MTGFLSELPSLAKPIALRGLPVLSCLEDLADLQLEVDVDEQGEIELLFGVLPVVCVCGRRAILSKCKQMSRDTYD